MLVYKQTNGSMRDKPPEFEIAKTTVYIRKNITRDTEGFWQYDEAAVLIPDYNASRDVIENEIKLDRILEGSGNTEQVQSAIMLSQLDVQARLSEQDETLAAILLNSL